MNENRIEGGAQAGFGELERKAGGVLGDGGLQARGAKTQVEGEAKKTLGAAQEAIAPLADQARVLADKVTGQAKEVYGQAKEVYGQAQDRAQAVADRVDPFVKEQPYVALGLAAASGLLIGLLLASRGPKVVYVRPRN